MSEGASSNGHSSISSLQCRGNCGLANVQHFSNTQTTVLPVCCQLRTCRPHQGAGCLLACSCCAHSSRASWEPWKELLSIGARDYCCLIIPLSLLMSTDVRRQRYKIHLLSPVERATSLDWKVSVRVVPLCGWAGVGWSPFATVQYVVLHR